MYRPLARSELQGFRDEKSVSGAVERAALAIDVKGRRFSHQFRLKQKDLEAAKNKLLSSAEDLAAQSTFERLRRRVTDLLSPFAGLGELYLYDTALRIGARLGKLPQAVYLHAGTRAGAAALGLDASARTLMIGELPEELRALEPHEIEDVLCIYKDVLGPARRGEPFELLEETRCYLDIGEPE